MFPSAALAALLTLRLLENSVVAAPAPTPRSDAAVSTYPRLITLSALLNTSEFSWGSCDSFGVNSTVKNLQCAYLKVPMDYHNTLAGSARLAVIKLGATAKKRGTFFFNPGNPLHPPLILTHRCSIVTGGPGGSGLTAVSELAPIFNEDLQGAFDVISWDPRGVGQTLCVHAAVSRRE